MSSYCLRRSNHSYDLAEHFDRMYKEETMVDVTLSCGEGCIKAHKMVLSACSSYFKSIFSKFTNPYQYPVVIIKDMPFEHLRAIIEFIYRGEVTVPQNHLASVLRSAEALKVKGLSEAKRQMDSEEGSTPSRKRRKRRRKPHKTLGESIGDGTNASHRSGENNPNQDCDGNSTTDANDTGNDKSKDGSTDEETSEYSDEEDDEETEKEEDNSSLLVTQRDESGRINDRNHETTNTEPDIEPTRLLEQSMITGDERTSGSVPRFQPNLNMPEANLESNINPEINIKQVNLYGDNSGMMASLNVTHQNSSSLQNSEPLTTVSSHNHVSGISTVHTSYEGGTISMPGPSNISPIAPRPLHHTQEHNNSGSAHSSHPQVPQNLQPAPLLPPLQMHPSLGCHSLTPLSVDSLTGKRHYQCPECFKTFTEKGNMKRHTQIHSQNRSRYVCDLCSKCFAWKDNFNRHRRIAHSELNCK